jgi:hypothetical protein
LRGVVGVFSTAVKRIGRGGSAEAAAVVIEQCYTGA